jgi:hypothetical protein
MVSLPAALLLQFVLPVLIFRELFVLLRTGVVFVLAYTAGLAIVLTSVLSSLHMALPLLFLSVIAVFAIFTLLLGESRLRRRYRGAI